MKQKPYPWTCGVCRKKDVWPTDEPYDTEFEHDGRVYRIHFDALEVHRCRSCGNLMLDDAATRAITVKFREQANLLMPEEIRRNRVRLGLTQLELAERLEVGPATISRWETGAQIQQRAMDKLLRLYFGIPEVRRTLEPPTPGAFRCLKPTPELQQRAGRFQLTAARRPLLNGEPRSIEEEAVEVEASASSAG